MKKLVLFLCFALLISTVNFAQVPQIERDALIDFYNVTDGANWNDNTNWNTANPVSSWFGVTTQIINSVEHVTGISLGDNNLQPNIPSSIGNLTELVEFFVVNTARLFGSANSIPVEMGTLSKLQTFWIEHWNLQGLIPSSFGNLNALTTLIISNTNMDGVIPSSLNTLPVLESFSINDNNFSGTIPDFTSSPINLFRIQNNNFQFGDFENEFAIYLANIATFTYSPQKALTVSPNNFLVAVGDSLTLNSAPISGSANLYQWVLNGSPVAGGTSVNLDLINIQNTEFGTYNCFVTNTIVSGLSILSATIQVSQDPLTHPDYPALLALYNATNGANWKDNTNWLDINQPLSTWIGITEENGRVTGINLGSYNNVIGTLPPEITTLTELKTFWIQGANLTGEIPSNIGDLANLTEFVLNYTTGLTGNIPTSLLNAPNLIFLVVSDNELEGTIPDFSSFNLVFFFIHNNKFQFGDFENEFTAYQSTAGANFRYKPQKRTSIDQSQIVSIGDNVFFDAIVSGNNNIYQWYHNNVLLAGEVSSTLTLNNIQTSQFGIYRCDITSSIVTGLTLQTGNFNIGGNPETNPDYPALVAFYNATNGDNWKNNTNWLDINQPLASWFGITETNGRVTDINLNRNFLNGSLPPEIGDLSELKTFNIINALQRELPSEFFNLTKLENLNLSASGIGFASSNSLTQIGNLVNLINLDLGFNGFSGNIPTEISNLINLQTLILHHNRFEGTIPSSFTALTNLQSLILSNNNLSGAIPDLSSISTLSNFDIQKNNLVFPDLEPNFSALTTLPSFVYSPQKKVGDVHGLAGNVGDTITLETVPGLGTGLTIDWYRIDELGNFTFISSGLTLDVTINTASDYGDYAYLVSSTIVTGLILESNKIILGPNPATHPDYNDLIALYNATNGDNWTKPWDITAPIHYWNIPPSFRPAKLTFDPVTDRVDIIDLSRNNLTGTLPPEVGNMTSLTRFQVFANDLTGEVPSEIWNLVNLKYLWLGAQSSRQLLLPGGIPPEISNMTNLFWLNLTWIPLTLPLQPELFNLPNLERLRMVNCGLTGVLPVGLGTIDNVLLGDNNFEGAIPADILNSTGNSRLSLRNNFFDFSDLEPLVLADNYTTLFYTPQRTKDVAQTVNETPGNDIVLSVDDTDISRAAKTKAVNNEYQWFKDNVAIAGANASTYTIFNAQPTDSGVYFCEITNPLLPGLVITRADITVNVGTLGIEEDELNTLKIYPNPTKDFLTIIFNNIENNGSLRIYDIRGRLVLEQKLKSDSSILDMTQFQNGMYILNIKTDNRNVTKKIIKQ